MKKCFTFACWLLHCACLAQDIDLNKRYSFARSYFGLDLNYFGNLGESAFLDGQRQLQPLTRSNFVTPALNMGGTHFWGHADFFVSLATSSVKIGRDAVNNSVRFRAITGMRVFPIALEAQKLRPYVSYKFAPIRLNQENVVGESYRTTRVKSMLGGGVAYYSSRLYAYVGYEWIPRNQALVYVARDQTTQSSFPGGLVSLGINYSIETTQGAYSPRIRQLDTLLRSENVLGWFLGVGPSSAFPTRRSGYITELYPFLDDRAMPDVFPELTTGYHFSRQDFIVSANFRSIRQARSAFSFDQVLRRHSLGVEAYKFLFDYHGFAPFVGAGIMYEGIALRETDDGQALTDEKYRLTTPGLVFGWDIRPSRRADLWLLRTNLRYSPWLTLTRSGQKISLQYLEFNFIQLVVYPQRIRKYKAIR